MSGPTAVHVRITAANFMHLISNYLRIDVYLLVCKVYSVHHHVEYLLRYVSTLYLTLRVPIIILFVRVFQRR